MACSLALLAQIGGDDGGVGADLRRRPLCDLAAILKDDDPLANPHDDLHVVLDQQDAQSELVLREADQVHQVDFFGGVHPCGGLVEQEKLRLRRERADNLQTALVAVGKRFARTVPMLEQAEDPEQFEHMRTNLPFLIMVSPPPEDGVGNPVPEMHVAGGPDIVKNAQRPEEPDVLKRPRDPAPGDPVGALAGNIHPVERHPPGSRRIDPGHHVEDRRLARTVRPDEADELVFRKVK